MAVVPYLQSKCITTCRKFQEHRYKITYHSVTLSSFGNAFSFDNFSISDLSCNFPSFPNIGNSSAVNTLRSASSVSGFNLNSDALTYPELFVKSKMPWIFLPQETQIPVTWKPVYRSGNHHWLAWLILIRNRTNVKPRAALRGISRLYICEISYILHNCQSVSLSPDCMDTETGIFMPITAGIFCLKINCFLATVHYYYSL